MITLQSIYEGKPPHRLFWIFGRFTPYVLPTPGDFREVGGQRVLGDGDLRSRPKPFASRVEPWLRIGYANLAFSCMREGAVDRFRWETPRGTLTAERRDNHMTEFPVKSVGDIALWHYVQENLVYRRNPDFPAEQGRSSWNLAWKWSPVQELLQFETGVENFYYLLADAPDPMKSLMDTMHRKNLEALDIGFDACPNATVLRLSENTSSQAISPAYYRELTVPHVGAYVDRAHRRGMKCVVHMCGRLAALFDGIEETGMDGIHSVTPPPVGDTPYMAVRERFGDDFIVLGRLNAQGFMGRTAGAVRATLREMIPERLVHTPFGLWITADEMQLSETDVCALMDALDTVHREGAGNA